MAQVWVVDGAPLLAFTCHPRADGRADRRRWWGVLHLVGRGESLLGPWDFTRAQPFRPEPDLFAAPLVADRANGWVLLGFRNTEPKGVLAFDLLDPTPVRRDGDAFVLR